MTLIDAIIQCSNRGIDFSKTASKNKLDYEFYLLAKEFGVKGNTTKQVSTKFFNKLRREMSKVIKEGVK